RGGPRGYRRATTVKSLMLYLWPLTAQGVNDQRHHQKHQKDEKQYLREAGRCACNTAKTQNSCDHCNNETNNSPIEHFLSSIQGLPFNRGTGLPGTQFSAGFVEGW